MTENNKKSDRLIIKIADVLVQKGEECSDYLTRPLFQVNMKLFRNLDGYRKVVVVVIEHMKSIINIDKFADYSKLFGVSGANVGVPWNIIIVRLSSDREDLLVMINPTIYKMSRTTVIVESNCGSLNLPKKIPVKRREWVEVSYFDEYGNSKRRRFSTSKGCGGTIQHEIDHNRGVLITDSHRHL